MKAGALQSEEFLMHQKIARDHAVPRGIPLHMKAEADSLLQELLDRKVIEPVMEHDSCKVKWISPAFYVPKPNGKLRLVTDFTRINQFIQRTTHPFPSADDVKRSIKHGNKYFAKLDAIHGYFQLSLDEEDSYWTTFLLPSGKYRYTRGPMGLAHTSDEWCMRSDKVTNGLDWAVKIVDDILIQAPTPEALEQRTKIVLQKCKEENIKISDSKMEIGQKLTFAGFVIDKGDVSPDPERTKALVNFPRPNSIKGVRSFLGLANQWNSFAPDLSQHTGPLRTLLKSKREFTWDKAQEDAFRGVKDMLAKKMQTQPFMEGAPTELITDAAKCFGMGFVLIQREHRE
jgi:hypothetical protein